MSNEYVENFTTEKSLKANLQDYLNHKTGLKEEMTPAEVATALSKIPTNDLKLSRLIREVFAEDMLYVSESATKGEWYIWDGTVWVMDQSKQIPDSLINVCADILEELSTVLFLKVAAVMGKGTEEDPEASRLKGKFKTLNDYALVLSNENPSSGPRKKIRSALMKPAGHFDNDQQWIVFADGQVLDTTNITGGLLPADSSRAVNRKMGITLGEGVPYRFIKSLDDRQIPRDQQQYLKIAAGAALLGRGDAKNIVTLVGVSNTGKSSYIETLLAAFGSYSSKLPAGAIVAKTSTNFEQHTARGARFIYLEEPYEARTDDSFLKDLSGGGGLVSTQQKGRDVVEWRPQGLLHIGANHVPKINTQDDAIVKRMNIVGFNKVFTPEDGVFHKDIHVWLIREEGPQIARWILEGAIEYDRLGYIPVPDSIKENATTNTTEASAPLRWLNDQFEAGSLLDLRQEATLPTKMIKSTKEMYTLFQYWCIEEGITKVPQKQTWETEINRFMGATGQDVSKRHGGSKRLWNVGEAPKTQAVIPPLKVEQIAPGHSRIVN